MTQDNLSGWASRSTLSLVMWIDNEEQTYKYFRGWVEYFYLLYRADTKKGLNDGTREQFLSQFSSQIEEVTREHLDELLASLQTEQSERPEVAEWQTRDGEPIPTDSTPDSPMKGLKGFLGEISLRALEDVDWRQIAEHISESFELTFDPEKAGV